MDFINQIHMVNFEDPNFELDPDIWKAVKHFFRRQWWTRVWVVKESFLAKKPKFYCDRKVVDRESFTLLKQLDIKNIYDRIWRALTSNAVQSRGPFGVLLEDWDNYKSLNAKETLNLNKMISVTQVNRCSEPVDKIFALLGMCRDLDLQAIKVDYTLSVRQLSIMVAKYELLEVIYYS